MDTTVTDAPGLGAAARFYERCRLCQSVVAMNSKIFRWKICEPIACRLMSVTGVYFLFSAIVLSALAACGGGGGAPVVSAPTVSITSNQITMTAGGTLTLTWSSTNATSCTGTGGWSGTKAFSGTQTVSGLTHSATFSLACTGGGGSGSGSVSITVTPPPPLPTVSLVATSTSVAMAATDTLTWSSTNATACTASGSWTGSQGLSGSTTVGPITNSASYTLTCTGSGGSTSSVVAVAVSSDMPAATPIGVLAAGVVILDANTVSMLVHSTSTTLTFNGTVSISPQEIFLLSGSAYIAIAVTSANGQTVVTVAAPTLTQVFSKIDLTGTYTLSASQTVTQSAAISARIKALHAQVHPDASVGVTYPWEYNNGSLAITGSGSLQLQAIPIVHYTSANGFANSSIEFDALATAQASLNVEAAAEPLPWATFFNVGDYRIPIPLTVVDGLLNLIGVNAAAIYVPVSVGGSVSTTLAVDYSETAQGSGGILVAVGADGTVSGSSTAGLGSNSLSFTTPTTSPSSSTPVLASLGLTAFTGVEVKPQLLILNTVAAFGADMKVGPQLSATVEVLPAGNSPPLCGTYSGQIALQANAFYLGLQGQSIWPSSGAQTFDLYKIGSAPLGASCNPQPTVTATPQGSAVIFTPLTVSVVVTSPSTGVADGTPAPTGQVMISVDDQNCQATIDSSGNGACAITPDTPGSEILLFQYLGDSNYQASALVSQPLDVAMAQDTVTVTPTPNPVTAGTPVTFTFVVSPSPENGTQPLPTGDVVVVDDTGTTLCETDIGDSATGPCSYTYTSPGSHSLTAVYSGDDNYVPKTSAVVSLVVNAINLQLSPASPSIVVGKTATLSVTASNASGPIATPPNLQWGTSSPAIATVSEGVVTGVAIGTAMVTVTDPVSQATASVTVTINKGVVLQISPTSPSVAIGGTATLSVTATDESGNPIATPANLQWSSSNTGVATVASGVVTGVAAGSTTITITDPISTATASATVTVSAITLQISPMSPSVVVGASTTLTVTASDSSGTVATPANLQWISSNMAVATVSGGVVTGVAYGSATITVKDPVSLATASTTITVPYPLPGSAPGAPLNPTVPTTYTQVITTTNCTNPSQNGTTSSTVSTTEYVLPPFEVQGDTFGSGAINWPGFILPSALQPANALLVVNGVSQASGSTFSPAANVGSYPSGASGTTSYTENYTASVSGVTLNERYVGSYNSMAYGVTTITQAATYTFTSTYVMTTGIQAYTYGLQLVQTQQDPPDQGCFSTTNYNEQGSTSIKWFGN
jgi:uncharacterized protein YjdB